MPRPRVVIAEPVPRCHRGNRASAPCLPARIGVRQLLRVHTAFRKQRAAPAIERENLVQRGIDGAFQRARTKQGSNGLELRVIDVDKSFGHPTRISQVCP